MQYEGQRRTDEAAQKREEAASCHAAVRRKSGSSNWQDRAEKKQEGMQLHGSCKQSHLQGHFHLRTQRAHVHVHWECPTVRTTLAASKKQPHSITPADYTSSRCIMACWKPTLMWHTELVHSRARLHELCCSNGPRQGALPHGKVSCMQQSCSHAAQGCTLAHIILILWCTTFCYRTNRSIASATPSSSLLDTITVAAAFTCTASQNTQHDDL